MFILYKKGKANYSFLGSYYSITLKNTLSKILKRVIINRMADMAKKTPPTTIKLNRGKKEPLNTISTYATRYYY